MGIYTLGVLIEIERMLPRPLHATFDLLYGTSTGAIIASMIALGDQVEETIYPGYLDAIPDIMGRSFPKTRTAALARHCSRIYGEKEFSHFLVDIGIVATHMEYNRPMVFKRLVRQAHRGTSSFVPGFGCTIADAVVASCAARPYFRKSVLNTDSHGIREAIDGGFVANNPTLFALTDALQSAKIPREHIRVLSIGTGNFPQSAGLMLRLIEILTPTIRTIAKVSSNTVETLRSLLFDDVRTLRIDDSFTDNIYRTNFLESRTKQLEVIFQLGRESCRANEDSLRSFFDGHLCA